jgi:translation initiation factor 2 beta subunit (eIF-2beta)/eIF-5
MTDTEYAKILNFYYRNYNKCPNCHKNIKDDSKNVINIKCSQCGYVIDITLSEYINLYQKLFEISIDKSKMLKREKKNLLP